jgi:PmbA protein
MRIKDIIPELKKFKLWDVFIYDEKVEEFIYEEGGGEKSKKEREKLSVAIRFSDGKKSGFVAQDLGKGIRRKNQIILDILNSDEKLEIPKNKKRLKTKIEVDEKIKIKKGWEKEKIAELFQILREKAKFKIIVDKISSGQATQERRIINSYGVDVSEEKTIYFIYGSIGGEKGGQKQVVYFSKSFLSPNKISPEKIAQEILSEFNFEEVKLKPGKYKVIFPPKIASQIIEFLMENFSADRILARLSRFSEKDMGKKFLGDEISIFELAHTVRDEITKSEFQEFQKIQDEIRFAPGTRYFDDEGEEKKNFAIIRKGVIESFITHTLSAKKLKVDNTGCAVRPNPLSPPVPGPSSLVVMPGREKKENYYSFADTIVVLEIIGLHTGDPIKGDFSVGCRGYIPATGKGFKNTTISGNIFELLKNPVIFDDFSVEGKISTPSIMLEGVNVS